MNRVTAGEIGGRSKRQPCRHWDSGATTGGRASAEAFSKRFSLKKRLRGGAALSTGRAAPSSRRHGVEEFEDRGQNHRHHAAVVAVDLEILEIEVAVPHELRERAAPRERSEERRVGNGRRRAR